MNTIAKIIVTTGLAFGALSAQAATGIHDTYPGDFQKATSGPVVAVDDSQLPYIFQGEFLIDNPKYVGVKRTVAEVRAEIPRQRQLNVYSVGA